MKRFAMTSKTIKTMFFAGLIAAMILPFSGMNFAEAKQVDDKSLVKEKIKDKMNKQADKDKKEKDSNTKYTSDEYGIPYNLIFEENGKLVVGIDAEKTKEFGKQYSKDDVKIDLDTTMDLDVRYYVFDREASLRAGDGMVHPDRLTESLATITVVKSGKIVTTGHAYALNESVAAGMYGTTTACQEVKITKDSNYSGAYADAAYGIDMNNNSSCNNSFINDSLRYNGNTYSVTYGTASDITLNKFIRMVGMKSGATSGYILDVDVTAKFGNDVLNDQVVGNYASQGGDSGAPIFSITGSSSVKLLGQHVGKACEVDLNSGTNFAQWCSNPQTGEGALTIFSPWDQVATHLGI